MMNTAYNYCLDLHYIETQDYYSLNTAYR